MGVFICMAEDTGLEPAGLLHLTRFPGELLSHSVNPLYPFGETSLRTFIIITQFRIFAREK